MSFCALCLTNPQRVRGSLFAPVRSQQTHRTQKAHAVLQELLVATEGSARGMARAPSTAKNINLKCALQKSVPTYTALAFAVSRELRFLWRRDGGSRFFITTRMLISRRQRPLNIAKTRNSARSQPKSFMIFAYSVKRISLTTAELTIFHITFGRFHLCRDLATWFGDTMVCRKSSSSWTAPGIIWH